MIAALVVCLALEATYATPLECPQATSCHCGRTGKNVTVCARDASPETCARFSNCESCDEGSAVCSKCPEGFHGSICDQEIRTFRQKHQSPSPSRRRRQISISSQGCGRSLIHSIEKEFSITTHTEPGDRPWMVYISEERNGSYQFLCAGAVLTEYAVVSAAQCVMDSRSPYLLYFGKHHFRVPDDSEVLIRKSSLITVHPNFNKKSYDSDIAVITFRPRIRYSYRVQPICLPTRESTLRNIQDGQIGYVGGWGVTDMEVPPEKMMLASLPVVSNGVCMDAYRQQNLVLTGNMFCAGYEDARVSVCNIDSGSPFVFYDRKAGRFTLEGLMSFVVKGQCGGAGKYAIFTKVFRFVRWITRNMK